MCVYRCVLLVSGAMFDILTPPDINDFGPIDSSNTHQGFTEFREKVDRGQHMIEDIIHGRSITL